MLLALKNKYKNLDSRRKLSYIFCAVLVLGSIIGWGVCIGNIFQGKPIWPFGSFVFSVHRFTDFFITLEAARHIGVLYDTLVSGGQYFPFMYLIGYPFWAFSAEIALPIVLLFFTAFYFLFIYDRIDGSVKERICFSLICIFCSYPMLFLLDRANFEIFVFIFTALFIGYYTKGKYKTAAFWLAAAINTKLFPAVLLFLIIKDKRWKCLFFTGLFTLFLLTVGFAYTGFNITGFLTNLDFYNKYSQVYPLGLIYGHSLFNILRVPMILAVDRANPVLNGFTAGSAALQPFYAVFVLGLFTLVALYVVFIGKQYWKNMLLLFLCMVSFPYTSQDFTLAHLIIPTVFFLSAWQKASPKTIIITVALALLFIPMNWWTVPIVNMHLRVTALWCYPITAGLILRPLIILFLIFYLMEEDFSYASLKRGIKKYFTGEKYVSDN